MKKVNRLMSVLLCALAVTACDNDKELDNKDTVNNTVLNAFSSRYPDAINVTWTNIGDYIVAKFGLGSSLSRTVESTDELSAWFDSLGEWYMTETDIHYSELPQPVQAAFSASEYSVEPWHLEDVDMLEREGMETIYVIEVEKHEDSIKAEISLYYSPDGILVKTVADAGAEHNYSDYIPAKPENGIEEFINSNYPQARITEIDHEHGMTEVEIIDGRTPRKLLFNEDGAWLYTKTEIHRSQCPQLVTDAIAAGEYKDYRIDDIDHYSTPEGEFYRVELKSANGDVKVDITPDGTVTLYKADSGNDTDHNHGNGHNVNSAVAELIAAMYPDAVIREYDFDDGYIKVEIWHEKKEKKAYFNGQYQWVYTKWDVKRNDLPQAVNEAVEASQWKEYKIDDIEFVQTPAGDYFLIELEKGKQEVKLRIDTEGNIL